MEKRGLTEHPGEPGTRLVGGDAVRQLDLPLSNASVNRHRDFALSRRMIDRVVQDDEAWAEMPYEKRMAVDAQLHANVC